CSGVLIRLSDLLLQKGNLAHAKTIVYFITLVDSSWIEPSRHPRASSPFLRRSKYVADALADLTSWIKRVPPITLEKGNKAQEEFVAGRHQLEGGRLDLAISHYREAIRLQPHFPEAHFCLGSILVTLALLGESVTHWENAGRHFDLALKEGGNWPE